MLQTYEQKSRLRLTTTVVAILVIAGVVMLTDHLKSQAKTGASSIATTSVANTPTSGEDDDTNANSASSSSTSATTTGTFKDGTYSASSSYFVPHGSEQIQVSLTVSNGTITAANVKNSENNFDSTRFQEEFTAEYKSFVVGKKISGLQISVIAGASDTTQGFNDALQQIAQKAKA